MTSEFTVAVHAVVYLAHMNQPLSSEVLACNVCTHPARIRKILAPLKKAGILESQEGSEGGYRLLPSPPSLTLRQIAEALDTPLVHSGWQSGDEGLECLVASGMAGVMTSLVSNMNELCLNYLETITIERLLLHLFRTHPEQMIKKHQEGE